MALLAIALAKGGHEVVVLDYEITKGFETPDGIKVMPIEGWDRGIRILRTITHRLPRLYATMVDQKADVYYCRIRDSRHLITYWAARKVKAKFIMGLAEDLDVMSFRMRLKHHYLNTLHNLWGIFNGMLIEIIHPRLIRKSDFVFVQHEGQKQLLLKKGKKSMLFPNMIDITRIPAIANPTHDYFIYVGWLDKHKGIVEFFNLVERTPFAKYVVIGPPRDKAGRFYYEKLKSFKNVTLKGELCHSDALKLIANSRALISTSHMEGFPNIFIEAWAYGIPVLSLYVDPGSIIENENLGKVAHGDIEILVSAMQDGVSSEELSERAKTYVERHHVLNTAKIEEIRILFNDLVNQEK